MAGNYSFQCSWRCLLRTFTFLCVTSYLCHPLCVLILLRTWKSEATVPPSSEESSLFLSTRSVPAVCPSACNPPCPPPPPPALNALHLARKDGFCKNHQQCLTSNPVDPCWAAANPKLVPFSAVTCSYCKYTHTHTQATLLELQEEVLPNPWTWWHMGHAQPDVTWQLRSCRLTSLVAENFMHFFASMGIKVFLHVNVQIAAMWAEWRSTAEMRYINQSISHRRGTLFDESAAPFREETSYSETGNRACSGSLCLKDETDLWGVRTLTASEHTKTGREVDKYTPTTHPHTKEAQRDNCDTYDLG